MAATFRAGGESVALDHHRVINTCIRSHTRARVSDRFMRDTLSCSGVPVGHLLYAASSPFPRSVPDQQRPASSFSIPAPQAAASDASRARLPILNILKPRPRALHERPDGVGQRASHVRGAGKQNDQAPRGDDLEHLRWRNHGCCDRGALSWSRALESELPCTRAPTRLSTRSV